jgi:hypothetical protein
MKIILVGLLSVVLTLLSCLRASAWGMRTLTVAVPLPTRAIAPRAPTPIWGTATHTAGEGTTASNKYGASASHAEGSGTTTATNAYGGSATHYAGQGTTATNAYGGSAYHAEESGTTTATNAYGGSATHYAGIGTNSISKHQACKSVTATMQISIASAGPIGRFLVTIRARGD